MDQRIKFDRYINCLNDMEEIILSYLDNDDIDDHNFLDLIELFQKLKVLENKHELNIVLHLISKIINNHHRSQHFCQKITKIIDQLKISIKKFFSNSDIFKLFKGNKYFLLILLQNQIFLFDKTIADIIKKSAQSESYKQFFFPEMKLYFDDTSNDIYENDQQIFSNYRNKGENHNYICQLIQNDLIEDFVSYVNRTNINLSSYIKSSIFETNAFLLKKKNPTLIEYAAFFGSIQIFNYLKMNDVKLEPSLWIYAIHSNNPELIHILEQNNIKPENETYEDCFIESIKCHHNNFAEYIRYNYLKIQSYTNDIMLFHISIKKYNFYDIYNRITDQSFDLYDWSKIDQISKQIGISFLYDFCKYDYFQIVEFLVKNTNINLNIRIENEYNQTALFLALLNEENDFIELLLSCPNIDVNVKRIDGENIDTLLNYALNSQKINIAKMILSNTNINVNSFSSKKKEIETALCIAIANNNKDIVDILLNNLKINVNSAYEDIIDDTSTNAVKSFLNQKENNFEMGFYYETPLNIAIKKGNLDIIRRLLSMNSINVNYKSISQNKKETALNIAIEKESVEIVKLLLQNKNIDVNSLSIIKETKAKFDESYIEITPLHLSIEKGNFEIFKLLASHPNININSKSYYYTQKYELKNSQEKTALHTAIEKKNIDIIKFLLAIPEVNVNLNSSCGYEKLFFFLKYDDFNDKRSKESQEIKKMISPLYLAVEENEFEIVKLLLSQPEINIKCKSEYTIAKYYFSFYDLKGIKYYYEQYDSRIINEIINNGNDDIIQLFNDKNENIDDVLNLNQKNLVMKFDSKTQMFGIKWEMVKKLFSDNKLNSPEFTNQIKGFIDFFVEIKYPCKNFREICELVKRLQIYNPNLKMTLLFSSLINDDKNPSEKFLYFNKITLLNSVTSIEKKAFNKCHLLECISIPSSVTFIGEGAFEKCSILNQIVLPNSITSIENWLFFRCLSLKYVSIPTSVTSIGKGVFKGCSSLEQISIPSSVTYIGEGAFEKCTSLKQIIIPTSVKSIGKWCFSECSSLVQISILSHITSIECNSFYKCKSLTEIQIPSTVREIGEWAFAGCLSLKKMSIPFVTFVGICAFRNCYSLIEITLGSSMMAIKKGTFENCSSLNIIDIPPSIICIEEFAFSKCRNLENIIFNSLKVTIGFNAFNECKLLFDYLHRLGNNYYYGNGVGKNKGMAFEYYRISAFLNNSDALFFLGYCYRSTRAKMDKMKIKFGQYSISQFFSMM